ncbi:MAG: sirohydrochlorin cobaltochelatase [Planctomycetota bacterium]
MDAIPIVLAAFGTTVEPAQKVYDQIEDAVRRRFPDHPVRWGYTAGRVRARLADAGIDAPAPEEALARFARDGAGRAVVQSIHVVPGQMDARLRALHTEGIAVAFGAPLLAADEDRERVARALEAEFRADRLNVVAAHGNDRHPEYNRELLALATRLERARDNVILCSVEGEPGTGKLEAQRDRAVALGGVHVVPLMLVAGDHILNDVLGDEPDAWVQRLGAPEATCAPPLGALAEVQAVFLDHIAAALDDAAGSQPGGPV